MKLLFEGIFGSGIELFARFKNGVGERGDVNAVGNKACFQTEALPAEVVDAALAVLFVKIVGGIEGNNGHIGVAGHGDSAFGAICFSGKLPASVLA